MNHLQYHLDNRSNNIFANSKPSERPSKPLLQRAPHQISLEQSYSTYNQQSLPLSIEAYSNDLCSSLDNSIRRTALPPPVPQGFLVTVGVGETGTNGSVSSDSGAMVATCGTVSVTGVVPPFLATLLATSAAAQTSFLT